MYFINKVYKHLKYEFGALLIHERVEKTPQIECHMLHLSPCAIMLGRSYVRDLG